MYEYSKTGAMGVTKNDLIGYLATSGIDPSEFAISDFYLLEDLSRKFNGPNLQFRVFWQNSANPLFRPTHFENDCDAWIRLQCRGRDYAAGKRVRLPGPDRIGPWHRSPPLRGNLYDHGVGSGGYGSATPDVVSGCGETDSLRPIFSGCSTETSPKFK